MNDFSEDILPPVNVLFLAASLAVAFILNLLPWGDWVGVPDFVALVLLFWGIHQPRRVGIGIAFVMGLLMDVHCATYMGEHALIYTVLSFLSITFHRRVLWYSLVRQMIAVFLLLTGMRVIQMVVEYAATHRQASWLTLVDCAAGALIWPVVVTILLFPQRKSVATDFDRPL